MSTTYITRHIESAVLQRSHEKGAVVITGPRQVGKTTLIEHCKPNIEKIKVADGAVICLAERILPLDSKNRIVPIWAI